MKSASDGYNDPSIHFVKAWKPNGHDKLEVLTPPDYNRLPAIPAKTAEQLAAKYANLLGTGINQIKNTRLYAFIDEWIGTPYLLGGMSKMGIDCSALVYLLEQNVYNAFGIPRSTNLQINYITRKDESELKEGDLVFFTFGSKPCGHVGIYLQNGYVLHASVSKGVTITPFRASSMHRYYAAGGSVPNNYYTNYTSDNSVGR